METKNYFEGNLSLEFYSNARKILKEEAIKMNSKLEDLGYSSFSLKEIKSCTSLVYRNFGNPEIVFSLSKQKPKIGDSRFDHVEFRNKFSRTGSEDRTTYQEIKEIFEKSNKVLLEKYFK